MLTKQGFKNAWNDKWYGLVVYVGSNNNLHFMEY
jgi:hypothetical protein